MKFEKISRDQFVKDFIDAYINGNLDKAINGIPYSAGETMEIRLKAFANIVWESIELPKRATIGSAGYDFTFPLELSIPHDLTIRIPTGIAWNTRGDNKYVLCIYPRSSFGIKYSLREPNLISIIDSDYYGCKQNGGHIRIHLNNEGNIPQCIIKPYVAYAQGIIFPYVITEDDDTTAVRVGGIGSTSEK